MHLDWDQAIENVLIPSSFLSLKYDLLVGPHNGVCRRTQLLVGKELEEVKLFSFWTLETLKVTILPK